MGNKTIRQDQIALLRLENGESALILIDHRDPEIPIGEEPKSHRR